MNELIIETKNLSKLYKTKNNTQVFALKDINLEIKKGELVSVMGPSGAGKTTLFNMIGLLDKPDYGTIMMNGYNVNDMKIDNLGNLVINMSYTVLSFNGPVSPPSSFSASITA